MTSTKSNVTQEAVPKVNTNMNVNNMNVGSIPESSGVRHDQTNNNGNRRVLKRNRVSYVCFACRKRKTRCDRGNPCGRCVALSTECVYAIPELNVTKKLNVAEPAVPGKGPTQQPPLPTGEVFITTPHNGTGSIPVAHEHGGLHSMNPMQQLSPAMPSIQSQGTSTNLKPGIPSPTTTSMLHPVHQQPSLLQQNSNADMMKIAKLEEELMYWKKKAMSFGPGSSLHPTTGSYSDMTSTQSYSSTFMESPGVGNGANLSGADGCDNQIINNQSFNNVRLSLDDCESTYFVHEYLRALHPPFSFPSLIFRDRHLTCMFASIFGFTYTDIIKYVGENEELTIQNLMKYGNSALISNEHTILYYYEPILIKHVQQARNQNQLKSVPVIIFTKGDRIEELVETEFPPALTSLLDEILEKLPPTETGLQLYINHFLKCIYPFYPFLNVETFLEAIGRLITYDPNVINAGGKPSWNIKKETLRKDLEYLTLLMIVIQISHDLLSVSLDEDVKMDVKTLDLTPLSIHSESWLSFSKRLFLILNVSRFHSEDVFCCMLYQRICYSFSPRESNLLLDPHPLVHSSQLLQEALVLGLHKDPTNYKSLSNHSVQPTEISNYRRKLWLGLCNIIFQETLPLGSTAKVEEYHSYFFKNLDNISFMEAVRFSLTPANTFDYRLIDMAIKKYQIGLLMAKIQKACTGLTPSPISEILFLISKLEAEVLKFEKLKLTSEGIKETIKFHSLECSMDISSVIRCEIIIMKLVSNSLIHNVLWSLFLKVEEKVNADESYNYYTLHAKLFEKMMLHSFKFYGLMSQLFSNDFEKDTVKYRYSLTKQIQQSYLRISLWFISILLKLSLVQKDLETNGSTPNSVVTNSNIDIHDSKLMVIKDLYKISENAFISLVRQSKKYSILKTSMLFNKTQCLFSYFVQILQMDRLLAISTRLWDMKIENKEIPQRVIQSLRKKWSINIEDAEVMRSNFFASSSLHLLDYETWSNIQKYIHSMNIPLAQQSSAQFAKDAPLYQGSSALDTSIDLNLDFSSFFDLDSNFGLPSLSF